jgi:cell wall integrity and stress response component
MSFQRFTAVAVFALASFSNAAKGVEKPAEPAILGTDTVAGCFSSLADMVKQYSAEYNTQGKCAIACRGINMPVGATYAKVCYCGTLLPNHNTLLNDTKCNEPCPGFDAEACMS